VVPQVKKDDQLENIINLSIARYDKDEQRQLEMFIRNLYLHPSYENLTKLPPQALARNLCDLWEFTKNRTPGEPKFKIYTWKPDEQSAISERLVIEILNDDMSFLVDSLTGMLNKKGLKPRVIFHPVFKIQRNDKGDLQSIHSLKEKDGEGQFESLIHCEVTEGPLNEYIDFFNEELPKVLNEVRASNRDWLSMRKKTLEAIMDVEECKSKLINGLGDEVVHFLKWIEDGHFTFLGYCHYQFQNSEDQMLRYTVGPDTKGILKERQYHRIQDIFEGVALSDKTKDYIFDKTPVLINKTSKISRVHRIVPMDALGIKKFDEHGNVVGMHLFLGLFTSVAYDSSARDIPLLRKKVERVLEHVGFSSQWHDGKGLIHILDSLPRDELFQASIEELAEIGLAILNLQERQKVALFVRRDHFDRFLSCLVYVPRDRFQSELCDKMGDILSEELEGDISVYKVQFGSLAFARAHYVISAPKGLKKQYDFAAIETRLINLARSWDDDLKASLMEHCSELKSANLYRRFNGAFSKGYQERFKGDDVLQDIHHIETALVNKAVSARIYTTPDSIEKSLRLKIYNYNEPLPLSDILPVLENLDLRVMSEIPFKIKPHETKGTVWIHDFELHSRGSCAIDITKTGEDFLETLAQIREGSIEDDSFNRLVIRANLSWRNAMLMRAYCKYLKQLGLPFSVSYIADTLVNYPRITKQLVEYFNKRFNPDIAVNDEEILNGIYAELEKIESADEDKIIRSYVNCIQATVRTNCFQKDEKGQPKSYMSFKFDCAEIKEMPLPKPKFEIFVHSSRVEGVHLRGGKVARGGIRWSDRIEDFRTEVLGLMKAQMVKNTVIIPVGSKGGFVTRKLEHGWSRDEMMSEGIECYKIMMRGLLDVTDNLVDGKVVHPNRTVMWDDEDPYLVVAADKGTATFSDIANGISQDYGFWLGDAFASGGSVGYDHKKMGITARGAWESVKRHFRELDHDVSKTPFTVIGVGDMGGDVFGNGMLLSEKIKMIAAFNHMHIFIDPTPDVAKSFAERQRLFNLPRSSWMDYNSELISKGGGIFDRKAKYIDLTQEMRELFNITEKRTTPNELIKKILLARTDLLWFGGIGTFVKSSTESHSDAGDRANDAVRVNAKDLKCRVIGEGANLGITQLARMEFARVASGRINTDAIDNSAGVDCSDHEVNIKILLKGLVDKEQMTFEQRNKLLERMTDNVSALVLRDNYLQTQAISVIEALETRVIDHQVNFMRALEKEGKLNRALEFLPDDAKLMDYQLAQTGLSRPELAVILAYSKIVLYDELLETKIPDDFFFEKRLIQYFPNEIQKNHRDAILEHPLRREIIATAAINDVVNRLGGSFVNAAKEKVGCQSEDVIRAYFVAVNVFGIEEIWQAIEKLDYTVSTAVQLKAMIDIHSLLKRTILWLLRNYPVNDSIGETTSVLSIGVESFLKNLTQCLDDEDRFRFSEKVINYTEMGLPHELAEKLANLMIAASSPDIILIASETGYTVPEVGTLYFKVGSRYGFNKIRHQIESMNTTQTNWHRAAVHGLVDDLYSYQSDLVINVLSYCKGCKVDFANNGQTFVEYWEDAFGSQVKRVEQVLVEANASENTDLALLSVVTRELRHLSGN